MGSTIGVLYLESPYDCYRSGEMRGFQSEGISYELKLHY